MRIALIAKDQFAAKQGKTALAGVSKRHRFLANPSRKPTDACSKGVSSTQADDGVPHPSAKAFILIIDDRRITDDVEKVRSNKIVKSYIYIDRCDWMPQLGVGWTYLKVQSSCNYVFG